MYKTNYILLYFFGNSCVPKGAKTLIHYTLCFRKLSQFIIAPIFILLNVILSDKKN